MSRTTAILQGESLDFLFDLDGEPLTGWILTLEVKKYAQDVASISRIIPATGLVWEGFLTSTETAALATGDWQMIGKAVSASDDKEEQIARGGTRFFLGSAWA